MPSAAEKIPMVPMKSFTGMPLSTWTFLKTSSAISGLSRGAVCPPSATARAAISAAATTVAVDRLDTRVMRGSLADLTGLRHSERLCRLEGTFDTQDHRRCHHLHR